MASGTADLQRDLGGAIMQSIFGALLTAGYAAAAAAAIASSGTNVDDSVQNQLTKSFDGAEQVATQYPQYADQITAAAKTAFLQGDQWAYIAGIVAVLLGAVLVYAAFPRDGARAGAPRRVPAADADGCRRDRPARGSPAAEPRLTVSAVDHHGERLADAVSALLADERA